MLSFSAGPVHFLVGHMMSVGMGYCIIRGKKKYASELYLCLSHFV
jgi:hypothetical protein